MMSAAAASSFPADGLPASPFGGPPRATKGLARAAYPAAPAFQLLLVIAALHLRQ